MKKAGFFEVFKEGCKDFYLPALLFCSALVFIPFLTSGAGLWDTWEPKYADASRRMLEQKEWLVPEFRSFPRFTKPILVYWLRNSSPHMA